MKILKKIIELDKSINKISNLGFVPTMGGLHKGHISLIKKSLKKCKKTLVSIYVNPKQFDNVVDYKKYPQNIKSDLKILKNLKVDYVFIPKYKDIYKDVKDKEFKLKKNEKILCAKFRKSHFEGVLNIMNRFLKIIKPKYVFMGQKDFQQLFLIKKYLEPLYNSKIIICKTIRNNKYLPLSSRNSLLSKKNLDIACLISKRINFLKKEIKIQKNIKKFLSFEKKKLESNFNIKIDYLEIRNDENLKIYQKKLKSRIFIAYNINKIRLIDNF